MSNNMKLEQENNELKLINKSLEREIDRLKGKLKIIYLCCKESNTLTNDRKSL